MAECSESTGTISPPASRAAAVASWPATTSVSLLASATRFPARSAASVASSPAAPTTAQAGTLLELSIPLTAIGAATQLGIVTWMINEKDLAEGSFAGLYANNFTDGYAMNLALTAYLQADFLSARTPSDAANKKP